MSGIFSPSVAFIAKRPALSRSLRQQSARLLRASWAPRSGKKNSTPMQVEVICLAVPLKDIARPTSTRLKPM
jgi:hypothetical protein